MTNLSNWEATDSQLRNWHVETRLTDDESQPGSRWEGRTSQSEDEARGKFSHLCTFPGLHVRLSQHHPEDAEIERAIDVHAPARTVARTGDRREDILSALASLDDGTGTLAIIVDQALADDPAVTVSAVREIVLEAIADARVEAVRS